MPEPLLLSVARLCVGLAEIPGPQSNPVIMRWAKDIGAPGYTDDSVAWCALAMNRWAMACGYPLSGRGYDLLRAKSFEQWGRSLLEPELGAVLVFSRPEGAHVGLYLGQTATAFRVLGGNQSNAVREIWIEKSRLTAIRWPTDVPNSATGPVMLRADGARVSTDEA